MSFLGDGDRRPLLLGEHEETCDLPLRLVPIDQVYSTASLCVGSSNVMSKKVKARKIVSPEEDCDDLHFSRKRRFLHHVYCRRPHRHLRESSPREQSFFDRLLARADLKLDKLVDTTCLGTHLREERKKRKRMENGELIKVYHISDSPRKSEGGFQARDSVKYSSGCNVRTDDTFGVSRMKRREMRKHLGQDSKRWVRLRIHDADPESFVGLLCKVFWPLDADWYNGRVIRYDPETNRHSIEYGDGDKEDVALANEKVKFYISVKDMENLGLSLAIKSVHGEEYDYDEMVVLAASLDDCQDFDPGDIIWAKLTGYAMWPAIVVDESLIADRKGLNTNFTGRSVLVQFFGTHDFARVKPKQVISFLKGLISSFHLKCKKTQFTRSLEEAKLYLSEQKLPRRMLLLRDGFKNGSCDSGNSDNDGSSESVDDCLEDQGIRRTLEDLRTCPYVIGDLKITSLGKIVKDSEYFHDGQFIWPEGYTALRKFTSVSDPTVRSVYKMEVLRDEESKIRPLFKVTMENGEQIKASTPSACWNKIYRKIRKVRNGNPLSVPEDVEERIYRSGSDMFGFSNPKVVKLIKELSKPKLQSKLTSCKITSQKYQYLPVGYRPVRVKWKDLDKCNVCHMDEEYENNLFLQCDKCRMMVHAKCYGELEPVDGVLWFCNLCRPGAPDPLPPCCLCPVIGGAMKPTTDGRWAHLACAIWIPETCFSDVKKMEPIDGIKRISRDRWKLLCTICGVAYGACIQCSSNGCRAAYHPLCARAAGLCVELEDEDRLHLLSIDDDDEENQCIRFLSFCKRHRRPSQDRLMPDERIGRVAPRCADYIPPSVSSGCARCEPYNYFGRRGRKEPAAVAAASLKRLYVENQPYLVGGLSQHNLFGPTCLNGVDGSRFSLNLQKLKASQLDAPNDILSMAKKYNFMLHTIRKRLAFGKSSIHGFGIFAKHPHRAGDMVIEYIGELVRPSIADRRERLIYNSLVGAGTYMFRIDDERVIDATRAGSIAHLINHSCEPNCYSRVISVNGDEHIIIFAKRDIKRWEELTYDYRFFSIDEQLACYCGFPRCCGIVNDVEAEERVAELYAPRSELIER